MTSASVQPGFVFADFELDAGARRLHRNGARITLHEKPFQLLLALLERAGEIVTRDELRRRLWPGIESLDFENGLNNAVVRLRQALGDTSQPPRFVETVPRRGYRFVADCQRRPPPPRYHGPSAGPSARFPSSADEHGQARDYFRQAIGRNPADAVALDALAECCALVEPLPGREALLEARASAEAALALDRRWPASHAALARASFHLDWDWCAADRLFKQAIVLAPAHVSAHLWYSAFLSCVGSPVAALAQAQRALELDPISVHALDAFARACTGLNQPHRVLDAALTIQRLAPADLRASLHRATAYLQLGMFAAAAALAEALAAEALTAPAALLLAAATFGHVGHTAKAQALLLPASQINLDAAMLPLLRASALATIGRVEPALDLLESALARRDPSLVGIHATPWLKCLHHQPRFQAMLACMGLPARSLALC